MGLGGYVISHNGATTVTVADHQLVHEYAMEQAYLHHYMDYLETHGMHYDINTAFEIYVEDVDLVSPDIMHMYETYLTVPATRPAWEDFHEPIVKMTVLASTAKLEAAVETWSKWPFPVTTILSGDDFLDVTHQLATKGNALQELAHSLNIPREEVLAIGNYYNDITMLEYAGLGVAMENSPDAVKAAADEVTTSNNEEGVHLILCKYVTGTRA
jgi:Cof subfamily protein (haloacid dehalogenase superfamily)